MGRRRWRRGAIGGARRWQRRRPHFLLFYPRQHFWQFVGRIFPYPPFWPEYDYAWRWVGAGGHGTLGKPSCSNMAESSHHYHPLLGNDWNRPRPVAKLLFQRGIQPRQLVPKNYHLRWRVPRA